MKNFTLLLLVLFMVTASIVRFDVAGIWVAGVVLVAAWIINQIRSLAVGITLCFFLVLFGLICPGLLTPVYYANEEGRCANCLNNLKRIGIAMCNYLDKEKQFPPVFTCDKEGKPLFSWNVALLPYLDEPNSNENKTYNLLKKDEPWDSPHNAKVLSSSRIFSFNCPSNGKANCDTNFVAIIGPGTIWRNDKAVGLREVKKGTSHTVALVEVADSGSHWAKPFALTVEEVLERMKTGKGVRISSPHQGLVGPLYVYPPVIHVLLADGAVRSLPAKMPISLWRQILEGEVNNFDYLESQIDPNAPDMVDVAVYTRPMRTAPGAQRSFWGMIIWLFSCIIIFYKAGKSRAKSESRFAVLRSYMRAFE